MLITQIKPIGKVGKDLLNGSNPDTLIDSIIEKPLQDACKKCRQKNIETIMSSANQKNVLTDKSKIIQKKDILNQINKKKFPSFVDAGKGYAWLMLNYSSLSNENKKNLFWLENILGEDTIWFVKSSYEDFVNSFRKFFKLKEKIEIFDDPFAEEFNKKQVQLMYNNKYPKRTVFIRMPLTPDTSVEEIISYFDKILNHLVSQ